MPRSSKDMRNLYTKGKYPILKNIPYPSMNVFDKFIHISLNKMCSDLFGFGYDVGVVPSTIEFPAFYNSSIRTSVYQGAFGKSLGERLSSKYTGEDKDSVVHTGIIRWADECDISGLSKSLCHVLYVCTNTFLCTYPSKQSMKSTPISNLGLKGVDTDPMEEMFLKDIRMFNSGCYETAYNNKVGGNIKYTCDLVAYLMDSPRRAATLHIGR
eukprot:6447922-Ditylum_brightwellii.AAC.1